MPKINQLTRASQIADSDLIPKENAAGTSTEAATAAQLAEYFRGKGVQVDNTLSTPGAAADAAKTGAEVADLKNALEIKTAISYIGTDLYAGYWSAAGVKTAYNNFYVSCNEMIPCAEGDHISVYFGTDVTGVNYIVSYYDSLGTTRIRRDVQQVKQYTEIAPADAAYLVFTFEKSGFAKGDVTGVSVCVGNAVEKNTLKIGAIDEALDYRKLNNSFDGYLYQGYWNASCVLTVYADYVCNGHLIPCPEKSEVIFSLESDVTDLLCGVVYYNAAKTARTGYDYWPFNPSENADFFHSGNPYCGIAPEGTAYLSIFISKSSGSVKISDIKSVTVFINGTEYSLWKEKLKTYADTFATDYSSASPPAVGSNGFGFLYFTDPHNVSNRYGGTQETLIDDLKFIGKIFEETPAKWAICGGDWGNDVEINVTNSSFPSTATAFADAVFQIGRVPNLMRAYIGENAYTVIGNHDSNWDGGTGGYLTREALARIWFDKPVGYYTLEADECMCYMLDMGYSHTEATINSYKKAEAAWFANQLLTATKPHLFAVGHIAGQNEGRYFGDIITSIANAYNNRNGAFVYDNVTYDFSGATGTFHFMMGGHYHTDGTETRNNIPIIFTATFGANSEHPRPIDLCFADFTSSKLKCTRVGWGNSREINIIPTGGTVAAS